MNMFELKNINLVYDLGKEDLTYALRNVNYSHGDRGLLGVIGPSGSGKSSLLYLMSGIKTATSGQMTFNGRDFGKLTVDDRAELRRKEFGFVFQRGYLLDYLTVLDNVLVPVNDNSPAMKQKALELLSSLGIEKLAGKKPFQLSGGQRQRVAIARALINDPKVVFADEPTSALDHKTAFEVMDLFSQIAKDRLVIVVTHDKSIIHNFSDAVEVWDGTVTVIKNNKGDMMEGLVKAI